MTQIVPLGHISFQCGVSLASLGLDGHRHSPEALSTYREGSVAPQRQVFHCHGPVLRSYEKCVLWREVSATGLLSVLKHGTNKRLGWMGAGNCLWKMPCYSIIRESGQQGQALAFPVGSPLRAGAGWVSEGLSPPGQGATSCILPLHLSSWWRGHMSKYF